MGRPPIGEQAMTEAEKKCRQRKGAAVPIDGPASAARARLAHAQAELAETKARALAGSLLDREAVQSEWSAILTAVRSRMLAVASRIQQVAPHLTAHDVATIDSEIRSALNDLAADQETITS